MLYANLVASDDHVIVLAVADTFAAGVTSEMSISFGRSILERFNVDWAAAGFSGQRLDELVEFMLRTLQSFILDPGGPSRHGDELRGFLHRWVAPAVNQHTKARQAELDAHARRQRQSTENRHVHRRALALDDLVDQLEFL